MLKEIEDCQRIYHNLTKALEDFKSKTKIELKTQFILKQKSIAKVQLKKFEKLLEDHLAKYQFEKNRVDSSLNIICSLKEITIRQNYQQNLRANEHQSDHLQLKENIQEFKKIIHQLGDQNVFISIKQDKAAQVLSNETMIIKQNKQENQRKISDICKSIENLKQISSIEQNLNLNVHNYKGLTPLHLSVLHENKSICQQLISKGANVNAKATSQNKNTPLLWAAQRGSKQIVELLISKGADVNAKAGSQHNYTPLLWAAQKGYKQIVQLLISKGADVNVRDNTGGKYTPLLWATQKGYKQILELLIENGADVNIRDNNQGKYTPLLWAAQKGYKQISDLLIRKGALINERAVCAPKNTPLLWAAELGHFQIATVLIANGANLNMQNDNGHTALHLSVSFSRHLIVELLLQAGVDKKIYDNSRKLAINYCKLEQIKQLLEAFK